jgi:hypothetical protein
MICIVQVVKLEEICIIIVIIVYGVVDADLGLPKWYEKEILEMPANLRQMP